MATIVICDSCEVFQHGLAHRLEGTHDVQGVRSPESLARAVDDGGVDLLIVDAVNGVDWELRSPTAGMPVLLVFDDGSSDRLHGACLRLTPSSVLHRSTPMDVALAAVHTTLAGGCFIDPAVASSAERLVEEMMLARKLTPRELDVCRALRSGGTASDIAASLHLSIHTVKHHLSRIYAKFGVSGRDGLLEMLSLTSWIRADRSRSGPWSPFA